MTKVKVFDYVISTQKNIDSLIESNLNITCTTKNARKHKITADKPIKKHSSNLSCLDITSSDTTSDTNSKIMENITTSYIRPWSRYTPGCFYNNTNSEPVSNNIKKCNVRRKAEILQYKKNSSRLTKAQKHAQFARGINKYKKKQYAYQSINSVRDVSLTTDANPYGMKAIGPPNMSSDAVADWLKFNKNTSDSTFLNNARLNSTGLIELKCEKQQPFIPTPLSSSDVPRVSQIKLNSNNPFPETHHTTHDNALFMNKRDPLVNYTPVQRTYKGGSEKWPQSTWKEGDKGFPVGKKGDRGVLAVENESENVNYSFDTIPPVTKGETILDSNNSNGGYAKVDDIITFEVEFTESVFLPPSPEEVTIKFKIGIEDRVAKAVSEFSNSNNKVFFQYTVVQGDIGNVTLPGSPVIVINSGYTIIDAASNYMTNFAIQSLNGSVQVNSTLPSAFNISVESTGGVIKSGYYNGTNTGIKITIPIANEPNLVDGSILIQTNEANLSPTYTDWGSKILITEAMLGNDYEYTSNDYNQAPGYIENGTVDIQVIITNAPGNSTASSTSLINDNTVPTVSDMSVVSNNNNDTSLAGIGDKVILTFTSSEVPFSLPSITFWSGSVVIGEERVTTNNTGNTFTSEYTVVSSDINGVVVFDITYTDEAGNTFSSLQNQSSVTVEIMQPVVFVQSVFYVGDVADPIEFRWDVPAEYQNDGTVNSELLLYLDDNIDRQTRQLVSNKTYRPNLGTEYGTYYLKVRMIRLDDDDDYNIINQSSYVESDIYEYNNPSSGGSVS